MKDENKSEIESTTEANEAKPVETVKKENVAKEVKPKPKPKTTKATVNPKEAAIAAIDDIIASAGFQSYNSEAKKNLRTRRANLVKELEA